MRSEQLIQAISACATEENAFLALKKGLPIGQTDGGEIVVSQKRERTLTTRHTCVTGAGKSECIRRMLVTLSCLYEKDEACFLIFSPYREYGELLSFSAMDITLPYVRGKEDLKSIVTTLKELRAMREMGGNGYPHLFVVLDGVDELPGCNKNGELEELRDVIELLSHREDMDVICGVELYKSIFSGYPGAFVGIGNCLITAEQDGKADVTYVQDDVSLSLPITVEFPTEPSLSQTAALLNSIAKRDKT